MVAGKNKVEASVNLLKRSGRKYSRRINKCELTGWKKRKKKKKTGGVTKSREFGIMGKPISQVMNFLLRSHWMSDLA